VTTFKLHPDARHELDRARRYYRERTPEVAGRFAQSILDVFGRIEMGPTQFPVHGLLAVSTGQRSLFLEVRKAALPATFPFVVFFYMRGGMAIILAVAHEKRRPGYWIARAADEG
jgi:toxin ParE1/3/4